MTRASLRRRVEKLEVKAKRRSASGFFDWVGGKWASLGGKPTPAGLPALPDLLAAQGEDGADCAALFATPSGFKCIVGIRGADL